MAVITKSQFVKLLTADEFSSFLEELRKEENFVLRELWNNLTELDVDSEAASKFVSLLVSIGVDIVSRYKESTSTINKYVVDLEGKGVEYILQKYASLHNGEALWIGNIDNEAGTVELYVKNGVLLV